MSQKTNLLHENITLMKERIVELEKHRNINTVPSKAVEEDFTIEATEKGLSFNYYDQSYKFVF